jgi:dynein heavy chain
MVVIDVHAKDVVQLLFKDNTRSITEFKWISQLRYYYEDLPENDVQLSMKMVTALVNVDFLY